MLFRITNSGGHGMSSRHPGQIDPGAVAPWQKEYEEVRVFAQNLAKDFAALGCYSLFRDTGFYSLADDDAHGFNSDVFIEWHLDSFAASSTGVGAFVRGNASTKERLLAANICAAVAKATGLRNRGVKSADFAVLNQYPDMDSVLVELFFVSNKSDHDKFMAAKGAVELGVVNAVLKTYGKPLVRSLPRGWSNTAMVTYRIRKFFRRK